MVKGDRGSFNLSLNTPFIQLRENKEYFILVAWQTISRFSKTQEWERDLFHLDIFALAKMNTIYAMNNLEA